MTDADWLTAVAAAPDDPLVRLAYADWLDDRGDSRGELLRLDVALAGREAVPPDSLARLVELSTRVPAEWVSAVCQVPTALKGWFDFSYCGCDHPTEIAPALFGRASDGVHVLTRLPRDPAEVVLLCRAARACTGAAVHFHGADPVVERALAHDPARCSRPDPPPPPVPRVYGGIGFGVAVGPPVEPEQPPNRRTMALLALALLLWPFAIFGMCLFSR